MRDCDTLAVASLGTLVRVVDTLSKSSITTYLRCGQQWYYAYVMKIRRPPKVKQAIGLAAHSAIEMNMGQKVGSKIDVPLEHVLDEFSDEWDAMAPNIEPDEEIAPKDGKDNGIRVVAKHHTDVAPGIQPAWVEEPVMFEVNGIPYSGWIDLVDDKGRVRDTKTTAKSPSRASRDHMLSMIGYALAYRQRTGKVEAEVVIDTLVYLKKSTKYMPIASGGPVTREAIQIFAGVIGSVAEQIEAGNFVPTGLLNNACSWCGYKDICPAYRAGQTINAGELPTVLRP